MKKNNVFNVLVSKGNHKILSKDKTLGGLLAGQIGVFNAETHLAVSDLKGVKEFYVAVNTGDGIKTSVNNIVSKNVTNFSLTECKYPKPHVIRISGLKAYCNKQYGLKIEFKNTAIYNHYQHNPFSVNYIVDTPCCKGCGGECDIVDCNELAKSLINAINSDSKGLVIARPYDAKNNVFVSNIDAFIATNKAVNTDNDPTNDVCLTIHLESVALKVHKFCSINAKYYKPRLTTMVVSFTEGFECGGNIEELNNSFTAGSGLGYDVMQREYEAMGWENSSGPYRISETTMLPSDNIKYYADPEESYSIFNLVHNNEAFGGWQDYTNDIELEIAVPCKDDKTIADLKNVFENV